MEADSVATPVKSAKLKLLRIATINLLLVLAIGLVLVIAYEIYATTQQVPSLPKTEALLTKANKKLGKNYEKHDLTVYYEALCPDSERFVEQLVAVYAAIRDYIQLKFVPYGLTKLYCKDLINGTCAHPVFSCKHGPTGCRANRLHGCILQYSENQEKQMSFITCTMGPYKSSIEKCISLLHFSVYDIDHCMTFNEGTELQLKFYNMTSIYKPTKLPALVFDDQYDEELQTAALKDFRVLICKLLAKKHQHFDVNNSPAICKTPEVFPLV